MTIIDFHHHALPPDYRAALAEGGFDRNGGIRFPDWDLGDSLAMMDRHGIDVAVLSLSAPGTAFLPDGPAAALARECNDWLAGAVASHPRRFRGLATLPLPDVDGARSEAARALDELGLSGVTLLTSAGGRYLGDPIFDALLADLDAREALAFVHPTVPAVVPDLDVPVFAVEFVADTTRALANLILSGALHRHRRIRFVVAHAGGFAPYITDRLEAAWRRPVQAEQISPSGSGFHRHPVGSGTRTLGPDPPDPRQLGPDGPTSYLRRLTYDTAASANPATLAALDTLVGSGHIVFGTDFPFVTDEAVAATVACVQAYFTDETRRAEVGGTNATALLGLDTDLG